MFVKIIRRNMYYPINISLSSNKFLVVKRLPDFFLFLLSCTRMIYKKIAHTRKYEDDWLLHHSPKFIFHIIFARMDLIISSRTFGTYLRYPRLGYTESLHNFSLNDVLDPIKLSSSNLNIYIIYNTRIYLFIEYVSLRSFKYPRSSGIRV